MSLPAYSALRYCWRYCGVLLLALLVLAGCEEQTANTLELNGQTMGTTWQVTVVEPRGLVDSSLQSLIDEELQRINGLMSTYDAESELSKFNSMRSVEWQPLSDETIALVEAARRVSKETSGAYDITLGSISALWGFGQEESTGSKPLLDDILLMLNDVGYQLLEVSSARKSVRKLNPDLKVDLSSLAKGYAVDKIGEQLEATGNQRYLVEIGGEIRTRGLAPNGERWKIGIEWPESGGEPEMTGIAVENAHIASSGDYRNYRVVDGERVTHILDGRSGYPISHNLAAVTVLHGSVMRADAWATAFMVLGYEESLALANKKGLAARFVIRESDGYRVDSTSVFKAYAINDN